MYQRRKAKKEAAELLDHAMAEFRTLSVAEDVRFSSLTGRIAELDAAIIERDSLRKLVG